MLAFERINARGAHARRALARAEAERRAAVRRAFWWSAAAAFAATLALAPVVRADVPSEASLSVQGPLPAGEPIVVRFEGLPTDGEAWITVAPAAYGDAAYDEWITTGGRSDGVVAFRGQAPGVYAIRAFSETPERHVVAEITVTVPRRHEAVELPPVEVE
jgi:hypothetical protein